MYQYSIDLSIKISYGANGGEKSCRANNFKAEYAGVNFFVFKKQFRLTGNIKLAVIDFVGKTIMA